MFGLIFDPNEVETGLDIDDKVINITKINWYESIISNKLERVVVFPYAQHFLAGLSENSIKLNNKDELLHAFSTIDFSKIQSINASNIKYLLLFSFTFLVLFNLLLLYTIFF